MSRREVKGCIGALVTPLKGNQELDEKGLRYLVNYYIDSGVHGLFPCGSQGEAPLLSMSERKKVIEWVVDETNGRVPVYAGTGCISTQETLELSEYAKDVGAEYVVLITPFYIKPNQEELYHHFRDVAEQVETKIVLYNNPGRSGGVSITADVVLRLSELSNVVGIKDSSGDLVLTAEYITKCGDKMAVIEGHDSLALSGLQLGADGLISGPSFSIAPKIWIGIYEAFVKGDLDRARKLQYKLLPLWTATCRPATLGTYPATVKEAMNMIGLPAGLAKKPLLPLAKEKRKELGRVLVDLGLTLAR